MPKPPSKLAAYLIIFPIRAPSLDWYLDAVAVAVAVPSTSVAHVLRPRPEGLSRPFDWQSQPGCPQRCPGGDLAPAPFFLLFPASAGAVRLEPEPLAG